MNFKNFKKEIDKIKDKTTLENILSELQIERIRNKNPVRDIILKKCINYVKTALK